MQADLVQVPGRRQQALQSTVAPFLDFLLVGNKVQLCPGTPASSQQQGRHYYSRSFA